MFKAIAIVLMVIAVIAMADPGLGYAAPFGGRAYASPLGYAGLGYTSPLIAKSYAGPFGYSAGYVAKPFGAPLGYAGFY